jgi:hypothetical protein
MKQLDVHLTKAGNRINGASYQFSLDEAGTPLRDVIDPLVRGMGRVDIYVRQGTSEVFIPEADRDTLSLAEAFGRIPGSSSAQGGAYSIDATATHEGAAHA